MAAKKPSEKSGAKTSPLKTLRARVAAGFAASGAGRSTASPAVTINSKGRAVTFDDDYGWRPFGGGRGNAAYYAGSNVDWGKEAGQLWENPTFALCLGFPFDKIIEAPPVVWAKPKDGDTAGGGSAKQVPVPEHPLTLLWNNPNKEYTGETLTQAVAFSLKVSGDAYVVKARGSIGRTKGVGPVGELWFIPHWQMEPLVPEGGGPTQFYKRTVGKSVTLFARDDVIHFRTGWNPNNPRKGWSRLSALLREVVSDNEIASFTASVLRNLGVVGMMVSPANKDDSFEPGEAEVLKEKILDQTSGDMRGGVVVSTVPMKIDRAAYSPQEMAIGEMGTRPEGRICAGFGFHPMALGLPSNDKKYANLKEARAGGWEDGIIPLLTLIARTLKRELMDEMDATPGEVFGFDLAAVRDLMPDLIALHKRARDNWTVGAWKLSEVREATGVPHDKEIDGYSFQLVPKQTKPTTSGADPSDGENPDDANDPAKEKD